MYPILSPPPRAPEVRTLAFLLGLLVLEKREPRRLGALETAPPCWEKAITAGPPLQQGRLVGCCTLATLGPRTGRGLGNLKGPSRGLSWVGQVREGLGAGCWLRCRGGRAQAWQAFSSSDG